jgi:hypothetical protein
MPGLGTLVVEGSIVRGPAAAVEAYIRREGLAAVPYVNDHKAQLLDAINRGTTLRSEFATSGWAGVVAVTACAGGIGLLVAMAVPLGG